MNAAKIQPLNTLGPLFAPTFHRPWLRYVESVDGAEGGNGDGDEGKSKEQSFTQADVDRIVKERLARQAKDKFGDYDELKTKAAGAQTLEDRLAKVEGELTDTKADALRNRIAAKFGISTDKGARDEPSDADLFLTGSDEATLTAQAQRLADRAEAAKKKGNVSPKEGETKITGDANEEAREFVGSLFGGDSD